MRYALVLFALLAACGKDSPAPVIVPSLSIVEGDAQRDTVGRALPVQLGAKLVDSASGAPLAGRVLNWVVVDGGGQVFAPITQTGSQGLARNQWTLGMAVGRQKLVARYIDPESGEAVTLDTATATAVGRWGVTVSLVNQVAASATFTWFSGAADSTVVFIPAGASRCLGFNAKTDSAAFAISVTDASGTSSTQQYWFDPAASPLWTATMSPRSSGSPLITVVTTDQSC